jgi:hypothetical protein
LGGGFHGDLAGNNGRKQGKVPVIMPDSNQGTPYAFFSVIAWIRGAAIKVA